MQTGKYRHTHCSVLLQRHALPGLVGPTGITGGTGLGETRSLCAPLHMQVVDLLLLLLTSVHQHLTLSRRRNCRRVERSARPALLHAAYHHPHCATTKGTPVMQADIAVAAAPAAVAAAPAVAAAAAATAAAACLTWLRFSNGRVWLVE